MNRGAGEVGGTGELVLCPAGAVAGRDDVLSEMQDQPATLRVLGRWRAGCSSGGVKHWTLLVPTRIESHPGRLLFNGGPLGGVGDEQSGTPPRIFVGRSRRHTAAGHGRREPRGSCDASEEDNRIRHENLKLRD